MVWPLALSLADQVEKYGAYAGIAAFFGLAVLSLLYFAQAREVKRLREWAGRAPERAREIEERAIAQAEAARRVPRPAAVTEMFDSIGLLVREGDTAGLAAKVAELSAGHQAPALPGGSPGVRGTA